MPDKNLIAPPLPHKKYDVIYADPPWKYYMTGGRTPENHYPTMSLSDLMALPIETIASDSSILYLWTIVSHLDDAIDLMRSWGFKYKSNMVWDKKVQGRGYYFYNCHEHLLVGVSGKGLCPKIGTQWASILQVRRTTHSVKPMQVYEMINQHHPNTNKIELFARPLPLIKLDGWDYWGNEVRQL